MTKRLTPRRAVSRRNMLAGVGAGAAVIAGASAAKAACSVTAWQVDGPFYPIGIEDQDWDLTRISGTNAQAAGEVIEVVGKIQDAKCNPVGNCVLEIWQANVHGRYAHPGDSQNTSPLDPNFQGYARIVADANGEYRFRSIRPAAYPAIGDWIRPAHIHFKVHAAFHPGITTQMYFSDDPLNDKDLLLAPLSPADKAALVVAFNDTTADGIKQGTFNMHIPEGWAPPQELLDSLQQ